MKKDKGIIKVLEAVTAGAETSAEASSFTGLPISHCSFYLGELTKAGMIKRIKKNARRYSKSGRASHLYFPLSGRTEPIGTGPLSASLRTIDTYSTPTVAKYENRKSGFIRPDTLVSLGQKIKQG